MVQNQFVVKVSHCGEIKRIKMPDSLIFGDLRRAVESSNWAKELPMTPYKYYNEEDGFTIAIDDQISFREAIKYCVCELNSSTLRLYIATSLSEADALINKNEALVCFQQQANTATTNSEQNPDEEEKVTNSAGSSAMSTDAVPKT